MNRLAVVGLGGVGRELVRQARRHVSITLLADRSGYCVGPWDDATLDSLLAAKAAGAALASLPDGYSGSWIDALSEDMVIADTTADETGPRLVALVERGYRVALANKKPLAGSLAQFRALTGSGATRYEATVGAGLPVVVTTQWLRDTGDRVERIEGCLSGTLGFLLSELEAEKPFAASVVEARRRGWTEPDPRDDLGGVDVARKALILARTLGYELELSDIAIEPLFPPALATGSVDDFMQAIPALDADLAARQAAARRQNATLRYVAQVTPTGATVGLREVPLDSPLGSLRGPDNMVAWTTERYLERPLVVRGPGAGVEVTASAVLFDLLQLVK